MSRSAPGKLGWAVALALLVGAPWVSGEPSSSGDHVLVQYGFDDDVPTGPDTVRVFQHARGRVTLSDAYRYSGYGSVMLRDVPGDRDFPELQGYFPQTREGRLFLQLALMVPDPTQELNIALAGPRGFGLRPDGIAFWLATRRGFLTHTSDSIPKRLFEIEPFTWYVISAEYDVGAGTYHLWVSREDERKPFVTLLDQPNAASKPGSSVHLFSLIGDNGDDLSSVTYYVDDVIVARSRPAEMAPFVAPGRRKFFVDLLSEPAEDLVRHCPPVRSLDELGVQGDQPLDATDAKAIETLLSGTLAEGGRRVEPARLWRHGCHELSRGRFASAEKLFSQGLELASEADMLSLGRAMALIGQERWTDLDAQLDELGHLEHDPRYARLAALAVARAGDMASALSWLEAPALEALATARADLAAAAWFTLLQADSRAEEALDYAQQLAGELAERTPGSAEASAWFERAGQAAFALRDLESARQAFEAARDGAATAGPWLSLADIAWLEGDRKTERRLRESVYGKLRFEDP